MKSVVYYMVCNYSTIPYIRKWFNSTVVEDRVWISNYILLFCVDVITHLCPNPAIGLANLP